VVDWQKKRKKRDWLKAKGVMVMKYDMSTLAWPMTRGAIY